MPDSVAPRVIEAGHLCLDIIATFDVRAGVLANWLLPGKLIEVGPAVVAPGGAVANTGLALHQLGVAAALVGKVGTDA